MKKVRWGLIITMLLLSAFISTVSAETGWDRSDKRFYAHGITVDIWNSCSSGAGYMAPGHAAATTTNSTTLLRLWRTGSYTYNGTFSYGPDVTTDYYQSVDGVGIPTNFMTSYHEANGVEEIVYSNCM